MLLGTFLVRPIQAIRRKLLAPKHQTRNLRHAKYEYRYVNMDNLNMYHSHVHSARLTVRSITHTCTAWRALQVSAISLRHALRNRTSSAGEVGGIGPCLPLSRKNAKFNQRLDIIFNALSLGQCHNASYMNKVQKVPEHDYQHSLCMVYKFTPGLCFCNRP